VYTCFVAPQTVIRSNYTVKGGLSLKIKTLHIHLYFIATQYL